MKRKLYRELYEIHTTTDPDTGRERKMPVYLGAYYRLTLPPEKKTRLAIFHLALSAISIALFVLCGWMNLPSSRSFFVLPFYLFMLFPLFYRALAIFRFFRLHAPFTAVDKDESIDSMIRCCYCLAVCGALYILSGIVFLALGSAGDQLWGELLGLACILAVGALAIFEGRYTGRMEVTECPKGN